VRRPVLVAALLPWLIPAAALWSSSQAHADPADNYVRIEAGVVCQALSNDPALSTVTTLFRAIVTDTGFSIEEAAKVVVNSVAVYCPENQHVLDRFVEVYADPAPITAGVGGNYRA
jgi:hypothetical protein